ncbi:MAG TPA: ABC transporter permease [Fibrobacteria bacterium]|nr:ABC transporter permease [Fibrobacteria bacterium]
MATNRLPDPVAVLEAVGEQTVRFFRKVVGTVLDMLAAVGGIFAMCGRILWLFPQALRDPGAVMKQAMDLGVASLPLIFVTSLFVGMVSAVSAKYQFRNVVPLKYLGTSVTKLVLLELGPVLTALVMSGRIGSSIAAQIATMKEKEEIDAMTVLDLPPLRYLAAPRILVGILALPVLTTISCFLAIAGAWGVCVIGLGVTSYTFLSGTRLFFSSYDVFVMEIKALVFGLLISLLGYYHGIHAGGGAKGVGEATMKSVVSSSVMILLFDFLIAFLLLRNTGS